LRRLNVGLIDVSRMTYGEVFAGARNHHYLQLWRLSA
jgi:hypothetical protein